MRQDHGSRDHALFAPSAAERWINCPDSIRAQQGFADIPSDAAKEGTECHEAASAILEGTPFDVATRGLTNDQKNLIEEYTSAIRGKFDALRRQDSNARLIVERRMRAPDLHREFHGTGDTLMVARKVLHVDDLKCGWNPVAVRNPAGRLNAQLASYVLLALAEIGVTVTPWLFDPEESGLERIRLTVHQPRVYDRPEMTAVSFEELRDFLREVSDAIERVETGDRTRKAGTWCKYCLARGRCPTLRDAANEKAKSDFLEGVENIPLERMGEIVAEADFLKLHLDGVKEAVFRALAVGRSVEGSKLVAKKGRKAWTDWDKAVEWANELGLDTSDLYNREPISPAQLISLVKARGLGREADWKGLDACYTTKSSGNTLVPAADPRPAVIVRPGDDFDDD
jgi:hypothetical protein